MGESCKVCNVLKTFPPRVRIYYIRRWKALKARRDAVLGEADKIRNEMRDVDPKGCEWLALYERLVELKRIRDQKLMRQLNTLGKETTRVAAIVETIRKLKSKKKRTPVETKALRTLVSELNSAKYR